MTCKDCICYDACYFHIDEETPMTVNECNIGFKHKDQYVKLPAYIGQKVWIPDAYRSTNDLYYVEEGRVSMLQQKVDKSWKIRVSQEFYNADYTTKDLGTKVFFTREEAIEKCKEHLKKLANFTKN